MSITALEIQQVSFATAKHGYDPQEVDEFLERVAADVDTLNRAIAEAASRVKVAEERASEAEERAQRAASTPAPAAVQPADDGITADAISKAFIAAQRSADALQEEARREAEKVYREAERKAKDIIKDAHTEKQTILGELEGLRASSEKFRTDFLSLVNHYQTDAQKRFAAFEDLVPDTPLPESLEEGVFAITDKLEDQPPAAAAAASSQPAAAPASAAAAPDTGLTTIIEGLDDPRRAVDSLYEVDELDIEEID
jgi:cell division initiation protein